MQNVEGPKIICACPFRNFQDKEVNETFHISFASENIKQVC
jgi:hypothetical protein